MKKTATPSQLPIRNMIRRSLRRIAGYPPVARLYFRWLKAHPLAWRKLSRNGHRLIGRLDAATAGPPHRRVLLYCPETLVREHFMALQMLARPLREAGHSVLTSHCSGIFDRCMPKDSVKGDAPKVEGEKVCSSCIRSRFQLFKQPDFDGFMLDKAITPEIRQSARVMIRDLPDQALADFTIDGIKLGRVCWHDLMLSRKLMFDTALVAEQYLYLRQYLQSATAAYLGMKEFLPRAGITDILLYGQYAANIAVICAARQAGVNWRLVSNINHLGVDRRRFHIYQAQTHLWTTRMIADWPAWRDIPLPGDEIAEIGEDVLIRFGAKSYTTYSPPKTRDSDVFSTLGLERKRKLIVAFTSSLDEYHAEDIIDDVLGFPASADERPYPDQVTWLTSISREMAQRNDLQLVIRIHPREDANKREGARSRHLELLRKHLSDLPPNVTVVWPADPVSSYDLLEAADLVQVWSSTVGLESARLGIPVIKVYRGYASYAEGEFVLSATSHAGIMTAMGEALAWTPDLDRLIKAWRFYAYSRFGTSVDLRDVIPDIRFSVTPDYRRPRQMTVLTDAIFGDAPLTAINRHRPQLLENRLPTLEEGLAVQSELRGIVHAIFTGEISSQDVPLRLQRGGALAKNAPSGSLAIDGYNCTYAWEGNIYARYSPMCARLASVAARQSVPIVSPA